jgi:hypothetical protein
MFLARLTSFDGRLPGEWRIQQSSSISMGTEEQVKHNMQLANN